MAQVHRKKRAPKQAWTACESCVNENAVFAIRSGLRNALETMAKCSKSDVGGALRCFSQRVHVGIWYILRAQRGPHIPTLKPKYVPYSYMDPLGLLPELTTLLVQMSVLSIVSRALTSDLIDWNVLKHTGPYGRRNHILIQGLGFD